MGDHTGTFPVSSGTVVLKSAVGSSGPLFNAQVWSDRWAGGNLSLGLEYLTFLRRADASGQFPHGLSILTDPVSAGATANIQARIGFFNAAYRPPDGPVHPVLGAGFGIGQGTAGVSYRFYNAFTGPFGSAESKGTLLGGVQAFTGFDADLGRYMWFSLMPRIVLIDGHIVGVNQRYMDYSVSALLGVRF